MDNISDIHDPPRGEISKKFQGEARMARIETDLIYAGELTLLGEETPQVSQKYPNRDFDFKSTNVFIVFFLLIFAIVMWLKFGGSGAVLSAAPKSNKKKKQISPKNWNLTEDWVNTDRRGLLNRLANTSDYRAGMIELLRYSLLFGGEECDTIFARSDTEREAFKRLPKSWNKRSKLNQLLNKTELVHYGGRDVSQTEYHVALDLGREILLRPSERQAK